MTAATRQLDRIDEMVTKSAALDELLRRRADLTAEFARIDGVLSNGERLTDEQFAEVGEALARAGETHRELCETGTRLGIGSRDAE